MIDILPSIQTHLWNYSRCGNLILTSFMVSLTCIILELTVLSVTTYTVFPRLGMFFWTCLFHVCKTLFNVLFFNFFFKSKLSEFVKFNKFFYKDINLEFSIKKYHILNFSCEEEPNAIRLWQKLIETKSKILVISVFCDKD